MLGGLSKSNLGILLIYTMIAAIALPIVPSVRAADQNIDLDGNLANGAESRIVTRVLQTFPVEIENVIYNNATGEAYTFKWPGAGPGGFGSYIAPGPDVGTKWEWSTISQVYSIESPVSFVPARGLAVVGMQPAGFQVVGTGSGVFMVPGKSTSPAQVTPSSTSLTSSLVTFFSPEQTLATCEGTFAPGRFEQTITNNSGETITFSVEQQNCCPEPQMTICDDGCQFYLTDPNNCGGCGVECAFDEYCAQGACEPICPAGQSLCGEECFDLQNDPSNCGDCGVECAWDELCELGSCEPICPGQTLCDETCVDIQTDPDNCGDCGIQCAFDEFCDQASCEPICDPGLSLCGEDCVDLQIDRDHCGSCDFACDPLYRCAGGLCEPDCPPGHVLCGETCVNLLNDPDNCGTCGLQCGTQYLCANGSCEPDCPPGQVVCDEMCVDLQTDINNCGGCGIMCAFDEFCGDGACQPICPGETLCGESCVDTLTDPLNCGDCDITCAADEYCDVGVCAPICPGQTLCGEECVDIQTDPLNCGGCDITCGSQEICEVGSCVPACPPGETLCDGVCVNLWNDPDNCGACGAVCRGPNEMCLLSCAIPPDCNGICVECEDPEDCQPPGTGSTDQAAASFSIRDEGPRDRASKKRVRADSVSGLRDSLEAEDPVLHSRKRKAPRKDLEGTTTSVETGGPAETTSRSVTLAVVEAPVCDLDPIEQVILEDGESLTLCQSGTIVGKEVFTTATVQMDGQTVGQGPCAQIVPAPEIAVPEVLMAPTAVTITDTSGDGLMQPGETVEMSVWAVNLGTAAFINPVATLVSPPDAFNPLALSFSNDTSGYPDFPAFTAPADCDTPPAPLDPKTNYMEFVFTVPEEQDPDVGRVFMLSFVGDTGTDTPTEMPIVIGIGSACDPLTDIDGETYDRLLGLQSPVNAKLVPEGNPVNFSKKRFNLGSTVPMKLQLGCGSVTLGSSGIDPSPEIVALVHDTLGPQSLEGINGDNNANPDDPFFSCGSSACDYQFRTEQLEPGDYVISIQMPDTRVFQAGFTLRP